jgi:hypothetical protein
MNNMQEDDLKRLWQAYDHKIDKLVAINKQQLRELQTQKADTKIQSFKRNHIRVMLAGVLWVFVLAFFFYHGLGNIYFAVSVGAVMLFNIFAVLLYLKHIIQLNQIDLTESLAQTQRKLSQVYTSYTQAGRVLLLQAPFFCTFWYTEELVREKDLTFWMIQALIVGFFTALSIYLFRQLSPKNPSDYWRKLSNKHFGAEKLQKAMDILDEIK